MSATLSILNVGDGDTKISFDKDNPAECKRACRIVNDMLRRGYAILVQAGEKDGRPIFYRATDFDSDTAEYIVAGMPEEPAPLEQNVTMLPPSSDVAPSKKRGKYGKRLPAESTRAVSVARSAGGMSMAANSIEAKNRMALINSLDSHDKLRRWLGMVAQEKCEWAGIPMPLDDFKLVIEPTYPYAKDLMAMGKAHAAELHEDEIEDKEEGLTLRNVFYSSHKRADICAIQTKDGRVTWGLRAAIHHGPMEINTLGSQEAWGIEQEAAAVQTLGTLVRHRQFKQYMLTGQFLEASRRSSLTYLFRRLRPTIALGPDKSGKQMSIRAALCMHPIGYYAGTWSGAMCPTDDVIAHLMLMRGDEPMYWRRCNQHRPHRPEAGL